MQPDQDPVFSASQSNSLASVNTVNSISACVFGTQYAPVTFYFQSKNNFFLLFFAYFISICSFSTSSSTCLFQLANFYILLNLF